MIKELPITAERFKEIMSYSIFINDNWAQGHSESELKSLTDYLTLSEMNSVINSQPFFSFIKEIWNINYKHHTIVVPDQIYHYYDEPANLTGFPQEPRYEFFLLNILELGYPCVLRLVNNHLILQSLDEYNDITVEEIEDCAYNNFRNRQKAELEIGGFCFAKE